MDKTESVYGAARCGRCGVERADHDRFAEYLGNEDIPKHKWKKPRLALHQAVRAALRGDEQSDDVPILKPWDGKPLMPVPDSDNSLESERRYDSVKQALGDK